MAKGIYVGATKEETLVPFTSNPAPTTGWTTDSAQISTATNDYGQWRIAATNGSTTSSEAIYQAVDGDTSTCWKGLATSSDSATSSLRLSLPDGVSINPTQITVQHNRCGNSSNSAKLIGYTADGEKVELGALARHTSNKSETFTISADKYYTEFELLLYRYSSSYLIQYIYDFKIDTGTLKLPIPQSNIAHKVTKAYVGVAEQLVQGDIIPKTWTEVEKALSYVAEDGTKLIASDVSTTSNSAMVAKNACDGHLEGTYGRWQSGSNTSEHWLKLEFPETITITKMGILISEYDRVANAVIQGSNNDSSWTTLSSSLPFYAWTSTPTSLDEVTILNPAPYKYYRVYITNATSYVEIREWQVSEYLTKPNIARKVKKGYIGVNGVAQLFYENLTLISTTVSTATMRLNSFSSGAKTLTGYISGLSNAYKPTVTWTTTASNGFVMANHYDNTAEAIAFTIFVNGSSKTTSLSNINTRLASTTYDSDTYMLIGGTSGCTGTYSATILIDFGIARSFTINQKSPTGTGYTGKLTCYVSSDNSTWTTLSSGSKATNKRYCKIVLTNLEALEAYPWSYFYFSDITDWIYQ